MSFGCRAQSVIAQAEVQSEFPANLPVILGIVAIFPTPRLVVPRKGANLVATHEATQQF